MTQVFKAESCFRHTNRVEFRRIADEILLVPIRSDSRQKLGIYTLNRVGSVVWELIDGTRKLAEVIDGVCSRFKIDSETARRDTELFCRELLSFRAIEAIPQEPS
ncbi:MAG: PqqD family protein [Deltaproteobacteria bacterium]|nr:PqqD family protein [Deltaproteobacteria bacterium]